MDSTMAFPPLPVVCLSRLQSIAPASERVPARYITGVPVTAGQAPAPAAQLQGSSVKGTEGPTRKRSAVLTRDVGVAKGAGPPGRPAARTGAPPPPRAPGGTLPFGPANGRGLARTAGGRIAGRGRRKSA